MDNSGDRLDKAWSTPLPAGIALVALALALWGGAAASYADPAGVVLLSLAGLMVLVTGLMALIRRPRLTLHRGTDPVLTVRTITGRRSFAKSEIDGVTLLSTRRLAARSTQLVVDLRDGGLLVFSRWDLGENPRIVADALIVAGLPVSTRD